MSISVQLQQIVDYIGITPNAFATKIGVSQPRFRNYLNGRAPDYDTLKQICITFVMIDEHWLLTGEGEMIKANEPNNIDNNILLDKVISQAEEIGRLKGRIELLEQEKK